MKFFYRIVIYFFLIGSLLYGCQAYDISQLQKKSFGLIKFKEKTSGPVDSKNPLSSNNNSLVLSDILDGSLADINEGTDFVSIMSFALDKDPVVIAQRRAAAAKFSAVEVNEAQKNFQINSTFYGGIEDITDDTKGVAVSLAATKHIYDGGMLDAEIMSRRLQAEAAEFDLRATLDERAFRLGTIWLELEKYETLKEQIDGRLAVLNPLIEQLEQVAEAGIGDVSKVTAAQRTVAAIRVTQTNISEGLAQARLEFSNAFGSLSSEVSYDNTYIANLIPSSIEPGMAEKSPLLVSKYLDYQARLSNVAAIRAKGDFNLGFEARALRPFAGSGYDSDESLGLVARKLLYNGGMLESEIDEALALAEAGAADIRASFREGARKVETAYQSIRSMDKAILLAKNNAKLTSDEIAYLRRQLIIGGSTLDSILTAEAQLYEAEAQAITFSAEMRKSQLAIVTTLGLLSSSMGF